MAHHEADLDSGLFTATVTSLAHSFGDRTRRSIYLYLRENSGATASELAEHTGVHPNVVRHHLERLVAAGYVVAGEVRRATVGRPAKGYRVANGAPALEEAVGSSGLLVALLERALTELGSTRAEALAHDVGLDYGRSIAGTTLVEGAPPARAALASLAGLLRAHGFDARTEGEGETLEVVAENCPFGAAAQDHPVLCAIDRGLVAGIVEGLGYDASTVTLTSRANRSDHCRVTA